MKNLSLIFDDSDFLDDLVFVRTFKNAIEKKLKQKCLVPKRFYKELVGLLERVDNYHCSYTQRQCECGRLVFAMIDEKNVKCPDCKRVLSFS